jgi:hypothetical protein
MTAAERTEHVLELRATGLTNRQIAARLGLSKSYVARLGNPCYAAGLVASREAKRRRTGTCVECGATTRYAGKGSAVSERCGACGSARGGRNSTKWTRETLIDRIHEWAAKYGSPPAIPDWNPTQARLINDEWRANRFESDQHWPWSTSVVYRFGSWNAGLLAAGYKPRAANGGGGNQYLRRAS